MIDYPATRVGLGLRWFESELNDGLFQGLPFLGAHGHLRLGWASLFSVHAKTYGLRLTQLQIMMLES